MKFRYLIFLVMLFFYSCRELVQNEFPEFTRVPTVNTVTRVDKYSAIFYGINCGLQLLPFLIKEDDFRFDFYITGKFGGFYLSSPPNHFSHGTNLEYSIGPGISFYLSKHLGLFAEYCYGKYYFNDKTNLRYGLTLKF
jgi:hypothetical protein